MIGQYLCIGRSRCADGKMGITFRPVESARDFTANLIFDAKRWKDCGAGVVYEMDVNDKEEGGKTVVLSSVKFVRRFEDEAFVAELRAAEYAETQAELLRKRNQAETFDQILAERLEPIRDAWIKADPLGRTFIEVKVLNFLRRKRW